MAEKLTKREKKEQKRVEYQEIIARQKRNETFKKFGIWGGAALLLILSVWGLIAVANSTPNKSNGEITAPPVTTEDITIGSDSAKVKLTEYADFQCPACAAYHPVVTQILTEYDGKVQLAYRFFPLRQIHQNADISARAAYAAHKQGKFREMHNLLFENQSSWANEQDPRKIFEGYAKEIGLDVEKFKTDMDSDEAKDRVADSFSQGNNIGVNSTPTFFLNNKKIELPGTYDNFKKLIENELSKEQ